ncbi:MAG: MFS transporter [Candidatus Omnitrophica bacterium]|nr:MFS transporter [Candidatus Omnitrophota bacterium]
MVENDLTERTYYYERWRAIFAGIIETAGTTFLLLIAVRWFSAGAMTKAIVAGAGSLGLLISPLVVTLVGVSRMTAARAAALLAALGAVCFFVMALVPVLPIFVVGSVLAMAAASASLPLLTQIYQENYPGRIRGRLFSKAIMIRIAMAAVFSDLVGRLFSDQIAQFRWLLVIFGLAFAFSCICLARCPSRPLPISDDSDGEREPDRKRRTSFISKVLGGGRSLRVWRWVYGDRVIRNLLICWMLVGTANLMMFPMRVEYLANPRYGLALSVSLIALLTGVIPNVARLTMSLVWGWLFDHIDFFVMRIMLNTSYALGILVFFMSHDLWSLAMGAVIYGVSNAGGDLAWGLWITKFAPASRVADYMAVHSFLTGFRGVLAPLVAFNLLTHPAMSMPRLGLIGVGLIMLASLILVPELRPRAAARSTAAVVPEISE